MIADELQLRLPDQESPLGPGPTPSQPAQEPASFNPDVLDKSAQQMMLEKSNILLLGPTGSGIVVVIRFLQLQDSLYCVFFKQ